MIALYLLFALACTVAGVAIGLPVISVLRLCGVAL
jgi:hypothetical protein